MNNSGPCYLQNQTLSSIICYIYSTCILSSCNHFRELPGYNNNNGFLSVTLH